MVAGTKAVVVGFRVDLESGVNTTAGLVPRADLTATATNAKVVGFNADLALGSGVNAAVGLMPCADLTMVGTKEVWVWE